jgi:hypothetical protein
MFFVNLGGYKMKKILLTSLCIIVLINFMATSVIAQKEKQKKLDISGLSWNKETQSFELEGTIQFGFAKAAENADFSLNVSISSPDSNFYDTQVHSIVDWYFDDPLNLFPPRNPYRVSVPWDRILVDGSIFQGTANLTVEARILNPAGKPVSVSEPLTVEEIEIGPRMRIR